MWLFHNTKPIVILPVEVTRPIESHTSNKQKVRKMNLKSTLLTTAALGVIATTAHAVVIVPTVHSFSSELGNAFGQDRRASYTVDGSGLTGSGDASSTHGNTVNGTMWITTGSIVSPNDVDSPFIMYDLGGAYSDIYINIWNYNETGGFSSTGAKEVNIQVGSTIALGTDLGTFTLTKADESAAFLPDTLFLSGTDYQFVKITIESNFFGEDFTTPGQQGSRADQLAGLSEVRFNTVPEPSAALLGGLGMLALLRLRRR
jgi:hypothetical protein